MKGISDNFINELKSGLLSPILDYVHKDKTLCLEIRDDYINIYYRGGNLLKISEKIGGFLAEFNPRFISSNDVTLPNQKEYLTKSLVEEWKKLIPFLKREMDFHYSRNENGNNEREFQQLVVRENNFDKTTNSTDYFICDIEYAREIQYQNENKEYIKKRPKFDMIATRWLSKSHVKKNPNNLSLSFIEMKYLDNSLKSDAGIEEHLRDLNAFLSDSNNLNIIKADMKNIFNQKIDLGLIDNAKKIESFNNCLPEYIFILADHDPASSRLKEVLDRVSNQKYENFELKFAVSNFMGYGLYSQNIYTFEEFISKFEKQIYDKEENLEN